MPWREPHERLRSRRDRGGGRHPHPRSADTLDDAALSGEGAEVAARLAESATRALGLARGLLADSLGAGLEAQLEREARSIAEAGRSPDGREGIAAFLDRRRPTFSGRR
ncbi:MULTISPECIES: hypothetical protein [Methylobacterium]|uniref:hypothetical protein n=1 Tax=Methylobacterium TaxID=407 RepID=UPI0013EA0244|nr:hypothetical protein [Methylobacterium sp. DB0501]NGM37074.1 hypothetical protein [Methylobacterium sp. DB0501]